MRKYPVPKMPHPVPHYLVPEEDESADCPDCEEYMAGGGGECPRHSDLIPPLLDDPDEPGDEDAE